MDILDFIDNNKLIDSFNISYEKAILQLSRGMYNYTDIENLSDFITKHEFYKSILENLKISESDIFIEFQENIDQKWSEQYVKFLEETEDIKTISTMGDLEQLIETRNTEALSVNESLLLDPSPIILEYKFGYEQFMDEIRSKELDYDDDRIESISKNVDSYWNEKEEINNLFYLEK
jgi:hypothetical protein